MRVGIDLGTTYSLVAKMTHEGCPALLPDHFQQETFHTPSVVYIAPNCAYVGSMAETLLENDPDLKVIRFFKRQLGDPAPIYFDDAGTPWHAEAVAALVLKKLRFDAESAAADIVESSVITVPAHFNDVQRKAVLAAATLADIPVLGLVEEPVAAALHYGVKHASSDKVFAVYDFGGGTFDATVLTMGPKGVYVLSKSGLTELGGKELDEKVGAMILAQFERALGRPITLNARSLLELRRIAETFKIELCLPNRKLVRRPVLLGNQAVEVALAVSEFRSAVFEIIECTVERMGRCIRDAGLNPRDVDSLLLVGGSSMVPMVAERMRAMFAAPHQSVLFHEPTKAVAFGAAIHASQLSGEAEMFRLPPELRGVTGYCVGVRAIDPTTGKVTIDTLIKKNMPLPAKARKTYYTSQPSQRRMILEFVQFRQGKDDAVSLGQLVVGPLPTPRQNYPIDVSVENHENGTVTVHAYDAQTGVELQQVFGRDADGGQAHLATQRALVRSTLINNL